MKPFNRFKELEEIELSLDKIKLLQNKCLDLFKINPQENKILLKELNKIEKNLNFLKKNIESLQF